MNPSEHESRVRSRDRDVARVIVIEGSANAAVLGLKLFVGASTGSLAILGDAIHSLSDVANNVVAWLVVRLSARPPDRTHPYGHRKFETLAVFVMATLLTVLSVELVLGAFRRETAPTTGDRWALPMMIGVLVMNLLLATWEGQRARKLGSAILQADARHTLADVLTTVAVIVGWQLSAHGYPWIDALCAFAVAILVLSLAFGLFRRVVPVLVDHAAIESDTIAGIALGVEGVRAVREIRSRSTGRAASVDLVAVVEPQLATDASHAIADAIEEALRKQLEVDDATIHVEPDRSV